MAIEQMKYRDGNNVVHTVEWDTDYGIRPELSSTETEWSVIATDLEGEEQTEFIGRMPKK